MNNPDLFRRLRNIELRNTGLSGQLFDSKRVNRPIVISPDKVGVLKQRNVSTGSKFYTPTLSGMELRLSFRTFTIAYDYGRAVADRYSFLYYAMLRKKEKEFQMSDDTNPTPETLPTPAPTSTPDPLVEEEVAPSTPEEPEFNQPEHTGEGA